MELVLGGVAAVCTCVFTNPLEVVKIRMQLQGELLSKGKYVVHYRNVFHAAFTIAKNDGILGLQKGLVPALCFQFVMNGVRLGTYDMVTKNGLTKNKSGKVNSLKSGIAGGLCGAFGSCVGTPLYLVKIHLQARANEASIAVGHQHSHTGMSQALKSIYQKHGVVGLCRGVSSTVPRASIASAAQLSSFDKSLEFVRSKKLFKEKSLLNPLTASFISGFFVSIAMAGPDLVSTRFYNQGVDSHGKGLLYSSVLDCAKKIYRKEGFFGFYKGLTAIYFRLGPHTLLCLVIWDRLKDYYKSYDGKGRRI